MCALCAAGPDLSAIRAAASECVPRALSPLRPTATNCAPLAYAERVPFPLTSHASHSPLQTGAEGRPCNQLMVVEKVKIANEFYFAILMDREAMGPILVASRCDPAQLIVSSGVAPRPLPPCAIAMYRGPPGRRRRAHPAFYISPGLCLVGWLVHRTGQVSQIPDVNAADKQPPTPPFLSSPSPQ